MISIKQAQQNITLEFNKLFAKHVLKKKYIRHGKCNCCGRCCREIYVKHGNNIIDDKEKFKSLQKQHFFYSYLEVVDKTEVGLVFRCTKLDEEKGVCSVHKHRALVCRLYPQEEVFKMGGFVSDDCGYSFTPIDSFEKVLQRVEKNNASSENIVVR